MDTDLGDPVGAVLALHARLSEEVELQEVAEAAVGEVARLLRGTAALWLLEPDDEVRAVAMAHHDPAAHASLHRLTGGLVTGSHRLVRTVMDQGTQVRLGRADLAGLTDVMEPAYLAWFTARPPQELVLQPLRTAGRGVGLLGVARDRDEVPLEPGEQVLLMQVAQIVSVALQTQRLSQAQAAALQDTRLSARRLEALAHTDDLTGLPNRRGFLRALQEVEQPLREAVGVALLDLDDFKDVNDGFGHAAGDALLVSYAAHVARALPEGAVTGRMGGDEFAVLLRAPTLDALQERLEQALAAVPRTVRVGHVDVPVHASAGLALRSPGQDGTASDLLREADVAMYRAKRSGLPLARFRAETDSGALSRLREATLLRAALDARELVVHYQRIVPGAAGAGGPERLEALVRWPGEGGTRLPDAFLPLAQEIGVLDQLTDLVVDEVLAQLGRWREAGREVSVAVNVPARSLARPGFPADVAGRLSAAGLGLGALSLEVTEHELVDADARAAVQVCRDLGLDVAVDDFGMGFSALGYLVDVPASELKLDRSLVSRLHEQPAREVLVAHVLSLAHALGVRVVAEGVETAQEHRLLLALGADALQGFHLHRPCPAEQLWPATAGS